MSDDKSDLTRIEDLSEYLHSEDDAGDFEFEESGNEAKPQEDSPLNDLEDNLDPFPETEDMSFDNNELEEEEEDSFTQSFDPEQNEDEEENEIEVEVEEENIFETTGEEEFSFDDHQDPENEIKNEVEDDSESNKENIEEPGPNFSPEIEQVTETKNIEAIQEDAPVPETKQPSQEEVTKQEESSSPLPKTDPIENYTEVRQFAKTLSYGVISKGGDPSFNILIENIQSQDDKDYILSILREHQLMNENNENDYIRSLESGRALISHLNEYSAIYLANKFKNLSVTIKAGFSEILNPSDHYESDDGISHSSKKPTQNLSEHILNLNLSKNIFMTKSSYLNGHRIQEHISMITTSLIITREQFLTADHTDHQSDIYSKLINDLKEKALSLNANGILELDYDIQSIPQENSYNIICSGNAVKLIETNE